MSQRRSNASPREFFLSLTDEERTALTATLPPLAMAGLEYQWRNWIARPSQNPPDGGWLYWLILAGRGFGKTRTGAEWVREQVREFPRVGLIGKDAADMRSVMIEGESGIMACCPPWERPRYLPSQRVLKWPNGAISECRTGEDPEGVRGIQFDRLWCDEIAAWQYAQETWDMALLATRLGDDPRVCITTTPKPIRLIRDLVRDPDTVVTTGTTFENLQNLAPTFRTIIGRYEGTRLGRQELYAELLEDEGLAYRFDERTHVVPPFEVPATWERFDSADYGWANPTAWLNWAVDYDGNAIVTDMVYEPGWASEIVPIISRKRANGWKSSVAWADPSMWSKGPTTPKLGDPANAADEFGKLGVPLTKANNDRRAGFLRISELLKRDESHPFPEWHDLAGRPGSPRLFIMARESTVPLREQLVDAPLEESEPGPNQGPHPGEAVAVKWERGKGHAHAALRYGAMTRPSPSERPYEPLPDPRAQFLREFHERRERWDADRFENV